MKHLIIEVNSQTLKRLDLFKPAAGSVNYLTAHFSFSEDWSGTTKTAKCRKDNAVYEAVIDESGFCLIPHEVLAQDETKRAFGIQEFYISVEGVDGAKIITTTETKIEVDLTGTGEEVNAAEPTPEIYAQYIAEVKEALKGAGKPSPEEIKTAVNEYLDENPIEVPEEGAKLFVITLTADDSGNYTSDKTGEEIVAAFEAGEQLICSVGNNKHIPLSKRIKASATNSFVFHSGQEKEYLTILIKLHLITNNITSINVTSGDFAEKENLVINGQSYNGSQEVTINTGEFVFNVNLKDEESGECEIDVTAEELIEAFTTGRTLIMSFGGYRMPFITVQEGKLIFAFSMGISDFILGAVSMDGSTITASVEHIDLTDEINKMIGEKIPTIPKKLPNPKKIIFTGLVSAEYDGSDEITINIPTGEEEVETVTVPSDNLFDKSSAISGKGFYHSSGGTTIIDDPETYISYVALRGAGTYRTKVNASYHGDEYAARVPLLKEDKSFIQNITGTVTATSDRTAHDLEFTVTEDMIANGAYYYPLTISIFNNHLNTLMFVKDREYPSTYIPYGYIEIEVENDNVNDKFDNVLKGKTALFFGDSICAGTTVLAGSPEYNYGWGGLIGTENKMNWKNYGKNGAVITSITGQTRIVTDQIDAAIADYSEADYIIFEGGTNDADQLRSDTANLGTLEASKFSNFDTATFTGAFEALILKIMTSYPNAKIGYIVAQKMGLAPYDSTGSARRQYFDRAVEICKKWGIPYIDLWNGSPLNPALTIHYDKSLTAEQANNNGKYYTDGQHLTLAGYKRLAPQIEAWMRTL